ncbi:MAG: hypothetical protein BGO89_03780 [Candidatus Kapaibacterium thiocyanatum]|uniref:Uncharacterized protein n=1 Tax=Candidatus Kapaibacterium thiocyanatum TaxID=1895771 RepID=A0A1M3L582_9BACT|nr:MAG: hypothetical protein BGO89_03780 ['Candidatus Kapabacteria' thiocyanatum]
MGGGGDGPRKPAFAGRTVSWSHAREDEPALEEHRKQAIRITPVGVSEPYNWRFSAIVLYHPHTQEWATGACP